MSFTITNVTPGITIALTGKRVDISVTVRGDSIGTSPVNPKGVKTHWLFRHGPAYRIEYCSDEYLRWYTDNVGFGTAPFKWIPFSASTDTITGVSKVSIMPTGTTGQTADITVEVMGSDPIYVCTVNS
jgi:hypothetical protein